MSKRRVYRIDASSIIDFVIHLLPFDSSGFLAEFLKRRLEDGTIILNEAVYEELLDKRDGIALARLGFLRTVPHEGRLEPDSKLAARVRQEWVNRQMAPQTLLRQYQKFIGSGDFNIVALSQEANARDQTIENMVVTEEIAVPALDDVRRSRSPFKKIPELCRKEKVAHRNVVEMLLEMGVICEFSLSKPGGK